MRVPIRAYILALGCAVAFACGDEKVVDLAGPSAPADAGPDALGDEVQTGDDALEKDEEAAYAADAEEEIADEWVADAGSFALYFGAGDSPRVEIANTPLLNLSTEFAFEAWVYLKTFSGGELILNQWVSGQEDKFLGVDAESHFLKAWVFLDADAATWSNLSPSVIPTVAAWHHVAVSAGSGVAQLFLDGQSLESMPLPFPVANSTGTFYIGSSLREGWYPAIDGFISQVRLSSVNRYPSNFTPATTLASDASTLAYWPLDEGSGAVATDQGPSHLDGMITGGASWMAAPPR